jgi:type II secretory pathway pseudopilin PulG
MLKAAFWRPTRRAASSRRAQRGLSLVELLVGITVGMFVVAAAATLVATQLTDNRRLQLEVQVQQDLRATADIITRDIRRAGSCCRAGSMFTASDPVWRVESPSAVTLMASGVLPATASAEEVTYLSSRRQGTDGPFGFRFNATNGTIEMRLPNSTPLWQDLTDRRTMEVTAFTVTAINEPPVVVACPRECTGGGTACWPTVTVRSFEVAITGRARDFPEMVRSVRSVARLRNDRLDFNLGTVNDSCPS